MHIYQRNNIYHYRQRIPNSLSEYFKKHEIHKSLKTSNIYIARKYARLLTNQFLYIEKGVLMGHLTKKELDDLVTEYITLKFEEHEKDLYTNPGLKESLDWRYHNFKELANIPPTTHMQDAQVIKDATKLLNNMDEPHFDKGDIAETVARLLAGYKEMALTLLENMDKDVYRTQRNPYVSSFIKRASLDTQVERISSSEPSNIQAVKVNKNSGKTFKEAYDMFINKAKVDHDWQNSTIMEHKNMLKITLLFFGERRNIESVTRKDLVDLRILLMALPPKFTQTKLYQKAQSLEEIIQIAKQQNNYSCISTKTVNKYLTQMGQFWNYCFNDLEILHNNPYIDSLRVKEKKQKTMTKNRVKYDENDLHNLFKSPLYTNHINKTLSTTCQRRS